MSVCVGGTEGGGGGCPNIGAEKSRSRDELSRNELSLGPNCLEFV